MSLLDRLKALFTSAAAAAGAVDVAGGDPGSVPDMATCHEAVTVLQEFLDGELEGDSHSRVQAHFDICKRCYPNLQFEKSFREAISRASRGETATPELRSRVLDALAELTAEG